MSGIEYVGHACGKAILFGEHFVVHGLPALAIPLRGLHTTVYLRSVPDLHDGPALDTDPAVVESATVAVRAAAISLGLRPEHLAVRIETSLPVGCGLGSSAAFAVALVRALQKLAAFPAVFDEDPARTNTFAFDLERLAHGNPSGVDNTVVSFERPLLFRRGFPPDILQDSAEFTFVIADTGHRYSTAVAVASVTAFAQANPDVFQTTLVEAERVIQAGLNAYLTGDGPALGTAMNNNHSLLQRVGVSSETLDHLVNTARLSGAWGAKITGAGVGGSIIAVVPKSRLAAVSDQLLKAGANQVLVCEERKEP